ncbi:4-hydroxy-tetrahydrodipicolinate synthase [Actinomyces israelii]|uniref:4-hydroxy-tetrahydrodipicolinate synthase n=1 Tax=Actinomyces israelii TaxID=1659 RepID=A0ABT4I4B8_9ACTO|nr:4-hydroxy-tetrahydrodipicolinate synthase [Actinomyces israelii]MCZ0856574.1 4-hydroxy-tetrahydrodipicolinate synthase [Actinomyces israelii]WKR21932.1 4-hydroxy-tetrahydrodipicolinate synthase [Actinomyces israelii]
MLTPRGVIPALVTPLSREGDLLEQGLRDVIDYTIAAGVHGVFVLGSAGEFYGLSKETKRRVIEIAVEHAAGRVPVYAGASEITTRSAVEVARTAQEIGGVSALSVLTPYFMSPTQSELVRHFTAVAAGTELPIILYTNPARAHVELTLETIVALSKVDNIIGLKDSAGDLAFTRRVIQETPEDFSVLIGRDNLILDALRAGAAGAIASTANIAPAISVGIYSAFAAGDLDEARRRQEELVPLRALLDKATFPVVLKEGLRMAGVEAGYCLQPASELTEPYRTRLAEYVAEHVAGAAGA